MFSRRKFLKTGSLATIGGLAAAGTVSSLGLDAIAGLNGIASPVSRESLQRFVGETFEFENTETGISTSLKLADVAEFENVSQNADLRTKNVSLFFEGGKEGGAQAIYRAKHKAFADQNLLMVPVSKDAGCYEIIFSSVV